MYLTCRYNPSPLISKVQWIKDGIVIAQNTSVIIKDPRMNITFYNESQTQLSIKTATTKDAGTYICNVTYGSDSTSETKIVFIGSECVLIKLRFITFANDYINRKVCLVIRARKSIPARAYLRLFLRSKLKCGIFPNSLVSCCLTRPSHVSSVKNLIVNG